MNNFKAITKWYSGKALGVIIDFVIPMLEKSTSQKRWEKGASRKVHAALNKFSTATKNIAHQADDIGKALPYDFDGGIKGLKNAWFCVYMTMSYGGERIRQEEIDLIKANLTDAQKPVFEKALQFFADFADVYAAVKYLDSLRPAPVFVLGKTLSATVVKTIRESGLNPDSLRMPEQVVKYVDAVDEKGKPYQKAVIVLVWPKGTVHGKTKFGKVGCSRSGNAQCHACGHAIKNGFNWVPLTLDNAKGVPHSMWVGRDCAKNLFNIDMEGEAEYETMEGR